MDPLPRATKSMGRYAIYDQIGEGGMATVHLGRMRGALGFAITVAVKRLLPAYTRVRPFVEMFVDEARLSARVRHPNVVPIFDVVAEDRDLFLVMEYVPGVALSELVEIANERGERIPPRVASSIVCGALEGLHAAHEATGENGEPLGLVHRDISPGNILVGADGIARVLDFGVAKAKGRVHASAEGTLKGKMRYMAPEHLGANITTRASDIYSAGVVLWEVLTGRRLFAAETTKALVEERLLGHIEPPSAMVSGLPAEIDAIVDRATALVPEARFATAREMSTALERALTGGPSEVSAWVHRVAADRLAARRAIVAAVEERTAGRVDTAIAWIGRADILDDLPPTSDDLSTEAAPSPPLPRSPRTSAKSDDVTVVGGPVSSARPSHRREAISTVESRASPKPPRQRPFALAAILLAALALALALAAFARG